MGQKEQSGIQSESEFGTANLTKLFWKYSMFSLAGLILQAVSVICDGIFVGNGVGAMGLAAVGITLPMENFCLAVSGMLGVGGSALALVKLGEGDEEGGRKVYGAVSIFSFLISAVFSIIVILAINPVLRFLGAGTPELLQSSRAYAIPFLIGMPFCVTGYIIDMFARADERPLLSSMGLFIPAVVATAAEYIFIFPLHMGIAGSSISWVMCLGGSFLVLPYLQKKSSVFKIKASDFRLDFKVIGECTKIGFAYFALQICASVFTIVINNQIAAYGGGDLTVAAFSIINGYIVYLIMLFSSAFQTGMQPVFSYNLGAKKYARVAGMIRTGITQSSVIMIAIVGLVLLFPAQTAVFFTGPDQALIRLTVSIMRKFLLLYALGNISSIIAVYFLSVEKNGRAVINGVARTFVFLIPLLYILPAYMGLDGIWYAQPAADVLAFSVALIFIVAEYRKMKKMGEQSI